jgi:hypothetical protein
VAAQIHFDGRCEPSKLPGVAHSADECRFGYPQLKGNLLEIAIGHRALK